VGQPFFFKDLIKQMEVSPGGLGFFEESHRNFTGGITDGGRNWQRLGAGLPQSLKHEFGALCLEEANGVCSIFAGTTGGELFVSADNGDTWKLITSELAPISKKGHERLLAAS